MKHQVVGHALCCFNVKNKRQKTYGFLLCSSIWRRRKKKLILMTKFQASPFNTKSQTHAQTFNNEESVGTSFAISTGQWCVV